MGAIVVTDGVQREIDLLALAWNVTAGEVVRRLVEEFRSSRPPAGVDTPGKGTLRIHGVYAGARVDAVYHRNTMRVDITSGVLAGQSFNRPSGAAIAVVRSFNPGVNPNRNGWNFWTVTETGKPLQSVR